MESKKSRKFVVIGTINDDTKIFGTTYGKFKKILEEGFSKQFAQMDKSKEEQKKRETSKG